MPGAAPSRASRFLERVRVVLRQPGRPRFKAPLKLPRSDASAPAGVVRATIYVHFPTRENLIEAVTRRAISDVTEAIQAAEPARSDPAEALRRVVTAAWRALGRFHILVEVNARLPHADLHAMHQPVLGVLVPLIDRGQRDGIFRADVPVAWHLSMLLALIHAASGELSAGRMPQAAVEAALLETVLGAIKGR